MEVEEIPVELVDVSKFNTRKDLTDGQFDSNIEDLARSIERRTLIQPITVFRKSDGRYALIAGQRGLLAHRFLGWRTIKSLVHEEMTDESAMATSLVENVHRADMNPRDKAHALRDLQGQLGSVAAVCRETGMSDGTVRLYLQLLDLAPQLQAGLAAGEVKNTKALGQLAKKFTNPETQLEVWSRISGFKQDVQIEVIRGLSTDLSNLDDLHGMAAEGALGVRLVRNCPFDCPTIPNGLKEQVAGMVEAYGRRN